MQSLPPFRSIFVWLNPSFYSLFLCALLFQVIPSLSDIIQRTIISFLSIFDCSSGSLTSAGHLSITEDQWVKKVLKIESSEKHKTTKQTQVIPIWLMRIVWSSSEVKTCASGIWLCREEDSWPTWWRTPSTGKAKSWWTTSLGGQTEEKQLRHTHLSIVLWLHRRVGIRSSNARVNITWSQEIKATWTVPRTELRKSDAGLDVLNPITTCWSLCICNSTKMKTHQWNERHDTNDTGQ